MKKNKLIVSISIIVALILISTSNIFAGYKSNYNNVIFIGSSEFVGTLRAVRNNSNNYERIGCQIISDINNTINRHYGICTATNVTGRNMTCATTSSVLLTAIRTINLNSRIRVKFSGGKCTEIRVHNGSIY